MLTLARCSRLLLLVVAFFAGCGSSERHGGKGASGSTGEAGQDSGSGGADESMAGSGTSDGGADASPGGAGATDAGASNAEAGSGATEGGTGGASSSCDGYPITVSPADGTEAALQTALESFAPSATLMYNPTLGTLQFVGGLDIELTGCVDGQRDVYDELWPIVASAPELFQIDASEWEGRTPLPCSLIDEQVNIVGIDRTKLGPYEIARDIFNFVLRRDGDSVRLRSMSGTYVPQGDVVLAGATVCEAVPVAELEPNVRAETYDYRTYFQCNPTGSGTYTPNSNDQVSFGDAQITWDDDQPNGQILLTLQRPGELLVDTTNYSEELLASDANCPAPTGPERVVGFRITVDAVTGEVLAKLPGVGCVVC